jgi:xyloglucan-specific endo-beta-1,4-glucanase
LAGKPICIKFYHLFLTRHDSVQPVGSLQTSDVSIAGYTWDVWKGPNSNWETISFVNQDGNINNFNVDLNEFFSEIFSAAYIVNRSDA